MQSGLAFRGTVPMTVGEKGASLVHAGVFVLQDGKLVDFAERLEQMPKVFLLQITWDLKYYSTNQSCNVCKNKKP